MRSNGTKPHKTIEPAALSRINGLVRDDAPAVPIVVDTQINVIGKISNNTGQNIRLEISRAVSHKKVLCRRAIQSIIEVVEKINGKFQLLAFSERHQRIKPLGKIILPSPRRAYRQHIFVFRCREERVRLLYGNIFAGKQIEIIAADDVAEYFYPVVYNRLQKKNPSARLRIENNKKSNSKYDNQKYRRHKNRWLKPCHTNRLHNSEAVTQNFIPQKTAVKQKRSISHSIVILVQIKYCIHEHAEYIQVYMYVHIFQKFVVVR